MHEIVVQLKNIIPSVSLVRGTNLSTGYHGDDSAVMGDHGHGDSHAHDLVDHENLTTTHSPHYDDHEVSAILSKN